MCFFLRTSFLLRIAGGGAAPSPLHPPTRFYCVTGAPWYLLLFRLLFPSASTIFFSYVLLSSYILLSWYIFHNRPPLVPTPIPFAFAISINDLGSYVLLGTHPPHPLLLCNRRPLLPTLLPFAFSISGPPARVYVLPGAPGYLLLFVLLFPSASRICFPMCFFLRTSFLLRIAGGGAAPSPLHPPTRFYCVTFAPWYLLLFRLLFPSASTFFSYVLLSSYFLLGIYFATGAPWYLLLFLLLSASASTIWVPMCVFLCASFLVRIAGGGVALLSFLLVMSIV